MLFCQIFSFFFPGIPIPTPCPVSIGQYVCSSFIAGCYISLPPDLVYFTFSRNMSAKWSISQMLTQLHFPLINNSVIYTRRLQTCWLRTKLKLETWDQVSDVLRKFLRITRKKHHDWLLQSIQPESERFEYERMNVQKQCWYGIYSTIVVISNFISLLSEPRISRQIPYTECVKHGTWTPVRGHKVQERPGSWPRSSISARFFPNSCFTRYVHPSKRR